jgi:sugar lactone lactonase YvrE
LDLATSEKNEWYAPIAISSLGLRQAGGYVCSRKDGFHTLKIEPDLRLQFETISDPEHDLPLNRFNDGKVDPEGGYWAGTMEDAETDDAAGQWWRLGADGRVEKMDGGYHVTNGPAFDVERSQIYLTDSARQVIFVAKFKNGTLSDKRVFKRFSPDEGYPDGMCVDRFGYLWVCFWVGSCLRRFDADGHLVLTVDMPIIRPTSLVFVDAAAYVTSASIGLSDEAIKAAPLSGGLFRLQFDTALSPEDRFYEVFY